MILLIDNYDSFTYNLYQYIGTFTKDIIVKRNDKITIEEIRTMNPERIILSPGPKAPKDAGICMDVVKEFYKTWHLLRTSVYRGSLWRRSELCKGIISWKTVPDCP